MSSLDNRRTLLAPDAPSRRPPSISAPVESSRHPTSLLGTRQPPRHLSNLLRLPMKPPSAPDGAMPKNATPSAPDGPSEPEMAICIDDAAMVFRSIQDPVLTPASKKLVIKKAGVKIKMRRSTPAPNFKRDGRKRLVDSPLPEDKQLCKRIDFGDEANPLPDAPKCKMEIFPAASSQESEELINEHCEKAPMEDEQQCLAMVCYSAPGSQVEPGVAGAGPGVEAEAMEDNILLLASLDSADSLDVAAAQPLLAGSRPEKCQTSHVHNAEALSVKDAIILPIEAPPSTQEIIMHHLEDQHCFGSEGPGGDQGWAGSAGMGAVDAVSLEDFPPLEKERFMKIRNRFEARSKSGVFGSGGSGFGSRGSCSDSGKEIPHGGVAPATETLAGSTIVRLDNGGVPAHGTAGHAETPRRQDDTNAGTPEDERAGGRGR